MKHFCICRNCLSFIYFRYTELFVNNSLIHEYIDRILKDERISLNDSMIANFIEIYYGKVKDLKVIVCADNFNETIFMFRFERNYR